MIDQQYLDVRIITMGISLPDCADPDPKVTCQKICDKVTRRAGHLVATGEAVEREFGISIVDKHTSVTPMALVVGVPETGSYIPFAVAMDDVAKSAGVSFIGDFSVLVQRRATQADKKLTASIPEALAVTDFVYSSVSAGPTQAGINMGTVAETGRITKDTVERTTDRGGFGCAKLMVFCNAVEGNSFIMGAFHDVGEPDCITNMDAFGPGVMHYTPKDVKGQPFNVVAKTIKKVAFRMARMGQLAAQETSRRLGVPFGIVDLSLAPIPTIDNSVARILEEMDLEICDIHGTTTAPALLSDVVRRGGVVASPHVGGLSGAFIPVSEDEGMIAAVRLGTLHLDKPEAMTCVCPVGLDIIVVPGDTTAVTLPVIIADEAVVDMANSKATAVRLVPAPGKVMGDTMGFGGLLGSVPAMPVHAESNDAFVARGRRIPAPIQNLKS